MFEQLVVIALSTLAAYLVLGLIFALAFVIVGVGRIDPEARDTNIAFRLMILPASTALWPLLLRQWVNGGAPPEQKDPHTP